MRKKVLREESGYLNPFLCLILIIPIRSAHFFLLWGAAKEVKLWLFGGWFKITLIFGLGQMNDFPHQT